MSSPSPLEYEQRIRALERINATLAAELDRMRPVVEAAVKWNRTNYRDTQEIECSLDTLREACDTYEENQT